MTRATPAAVVAELGRYPGVGMPRGLVLALLRRESGLQVDVCVRPGRQTFWEIGLAQATVDDTGAGDARRYGADPRTLAGGVWIHLARAHADAAFLELELARVATPIDAAVLDLQTVGALAAYSVGRRGVRDLLRRAPDFAGLTPVFASAGAIGVQSAARVRMRLARALASAMDHPGGWTTPLPRRPPHVPRCPSAAALVVWCCDHARSAIS
jgi:hypothetical protein